jgi:hypothetical protein
MALEKADRVTDRLNRLRGIVWDLDPKFLLEGHHKLNRIQAVRA